MDIYFFKFIYFLELHLTDSVINICRILTIKGLVRLSAKAKLWDY
jgi:hypothetical protein